MKPIFFLLLLFSISTLANTGTDTITNWQVYKDGKLLFKTNGLEKVNTIILSKAEKFKSVELRVYNDAPSSETKRYLRFKCNGKLIATSIKEVKPYSGSAIFLTREELLRYVGPDAGKLFTVEYSEGNMGEEMVVFQLVIK